MPAPVKNVPTTVTVLPPAKGPELGSTAATEVWGAATEVEAIWTAGLVQVRWTGIADARVTVRAQVPVVPVDTEAVPAALPAVKLSGEPLAVSTVPGAGVRMWVTGTVRLPVVGGRRGPGGRNVVCVGAL